MVPSLHCAGQTAAAFGRRRIRGSHGQSWKIPGFWMIFGLKHPRLFWRRFFSKWLGLSIPPQTREITKSSGVPDDSLELIWEWMCQSELLVNDDLGSWGSEKTSFSKKQSCHIKTRFHRRGFCIDLYSLWLTVNAENHPRCATSA